MNAVVFDLDGTLIDSAPDIAAALNALLAEHGRPHLPLDAVKQMIGDGSAALLARAFAATGPALVDGARGPVLGRFIEIYDARAAAPDSVYPGVEATLESLKAAGLRLGLCTNKPERVTRTVLRSLGLDRFFDAVAGGDSLPFRKPDGRHLRWVLDRLGADADRSAMVGDNAHDVAVAKATGTAAVAVAYGYPRMPIADLGADAVIERFDELPAALARLGTA
ncbi:MAG TPA: phosphoglycolate phosphatase [Azospirillaceae bacterium]|nr:phosphoglycolate phosphatase [Azospirillaceae bacterium]